MFNYYYDLFVSHEANWSDDEASDEQSSAISSLDQFSLDHSSDHSSLDRIHLCIDELISDLGCPGFDPEHLETIVDGESALETDSRASSRSSLDSARESWYNAS